MSNDEREPAERDAVTLQAIVTSQAAYYYAEGISLKPCNWVKVHGVRGHTVTCYVEAGGEIVGLTDPRDGSGLPGALLSGNGASWGTGPYNPVLNEDGNTWFLIRGTKPPSTGEAASNLLLVEGTVADDGDQGHPANLYPTYQAYWDANAQNDPNMHFAGYGYTTGAPADGRTPCCIYVKADDPSYGPVRVTVTEGLATVLGAPGAHPNYRDVDLQSDGCAMIQLVDSVAETVTFNMELRNAPGTYLLGPFTARFYAFPDDPAQR